MVRAYRLAVVLGEPGEVYNLGRGRSVRLSDVIDDLIALCRVPVRVTVDPALLRSSDVPRQEADTRKFTSLTGWQPRIAWHTTLRDTLEYWREQIRSRQPA
jgi:GDP-4-dehydro-6-deoxy-D-mannose reductase